MSPPPCIDSPRIRSSTSFLSIRERRSASATAHLPRSNALTSTREHLRAVPFAVRAQAMITASPMCEISSSEVRLENLLPPLKKGDRGGFVRKIPLAPFSKGGTKVEDQDAIFAGASRKRSYPSDIPAWPTTLKRKARRMRA